MNAPVWSIASCRRERAPLADARPGLGEHRVPRRRPDRLAQPLGEHEDRRHAERPGEGHERHRDERQRVAREGQQPVAARAVGQRSTGQPQHQRGRLAGPGEQADRRRARPERAQPGAEHAPRALVDDVAQRADEPEGDDEARRVQARRAGARRRVGPRHHGGESGSGGAGRGRPRKGRPRRPALAAPAVNWYNQWTLCRCPTPRPSTASRSPPPSTPACAPRSSPATSRPGRRCPAERALAERFGVNRHAVREALKRLQQAGPRPGRPGRRDARARLAPPMAGSTCSLASAPAARRGGPTPSCARSSSCARASAPTPPGAARERAARPRRRDRRARGAGARRRRRRRRAPRATRSSGSAIVDGAGNLAYRLAYNTLLAGQHLVALARRASRPRWTTRRTSQRCPARPPPATRRPPTRPPAASWSPPPPR